MQLQIQQLGAGAADVALPMMQELYSHEGIAWNPEGTARALAGLLHDNNKGGVWLITADGAPAGYFVLTLAYSLEFGGSFVLLDEFYVREEFRGRGIGTQAIEFILAESKRREAHAVRLEVGHTNEAALKLYRKLGFRPEQRHFLTRRLE